MGYGQNELTPREREMIDLYNTCGTSYEYIQKSSFELIDPYAADPNMAYRFKNPRNKSDFIWSVYIMRNALNNLNIYALPDAVFRKSWKAKDIVNNWKIWRDDIDILYAVAKREQYLKQIKGNILMIASNLRDYIKRNNLPMEHLTLEEVVIILGATILNIRSIIQNEDVIKSVIDMSVTDKNLKFILEIYLNIKDKLVVKPSDVKLYEGLF